MILQVREGEFGYECGKTLFSGISFDLNAGEILAVLGPNGSGKTTLIKCIISLLKWRRGKTYICGQCTEDIKQRELWKMVGYVPQSRPVVFPYTVFDMVLMGRTPHQGFFSMPSLRARNITWEVLEALKISHLAYRPCSRISGGEMQLVLIARALVREPQVIVFDEPESHLDLNRQLLVLDVIRTLAKERRIVCVVSTHFPGNALRLADKVLLLGKEQRHIYGKADEVITERNLEDFFQVKATIFEVREETQVVKGVMPLRVTGS